MKRSTSLNNGFAVIIGAFFILEGLWGFTSDVVFGIFTTNKLHAVIHVILGILSLTLGLRQNARDFTIFLGLLLLIVGTLRFVPGVDVILINLLNANEDVAFLNILIGAAALAVAAPKPMLITEAQEIIDHAPLKEKPNSRRIHSTPIRKSHPAPANKPTPVEPKEKNTKTPDRTKTVEKKELEPTTPTRTKKTSKKNPHQKNKPIKEDPSKS